MAKPAQTPSQVPNPNPCLQVIAVFQKIGVKVDLFSMGFGESAARGALRHSAANLQAAVERLCGGAPG